jgi:hypothetical protein
MKFFSWIVGAVLLMQTAAALPIKAAHAGVPDSRIEICYGKNSIALKGPFGRFLGTDPNRNSVYTGDKWNGAWESFNFEEIENQNGKRRVYIKFATGKYLGADREGNLYATDNRDWWERFEIEKIAGHFVFIKTAHGHYITFDENGKVFAKKDGNMIELCYGNNSVALKGPYGHYIVHNPNLSPYGNINVSTDKSWAGARSSYNFEEIENQNGIREVYIVSPTGKSLMATPKGTLLSTDKKGLWERFKIETISDKLIYIKTIHGHYITFDEIGNVSCKVDERQAYRQAERNRYQAEQNRHSSDPKVVADQAELDAKEALDAYNVASEAARKAQSDLDSSPSSYRLAEVRTAANKAASDAQISYLRAMSYAHVARSAVQNAALTNLRETLQSAIDAKGGDIDSVKNVLRALCNALGVSVPAGF